MSNAEKTHNYRMAILNSSEAELYSNLSHAVTQYIYFMARRAGVEGTQELFDHCEPIYEIIMDTIVSETD